MMVQLGNMATLTFADQALHFLLMGNVIDEIGEKLGMPRGTSKIPGAFPGWGPYTVRETDLEYGIRLVQFLFDFWLKHQKKGNKRATNTKG